MQRLNRSALALLMIALAFWTLFLAFLGLHLVSPSDGARIAGGNSAEGLEITPLADYGLHAGDVVLAVEGRDIRSITLALTAWGQPAPRWEYGQTITYTALREGEPREVPVTLGAYSFGAIWARDWGAIVVALVIQLTMGFVFFKRPDEPIARAMFLASAALVSATTWSIGLTLADVVGKVGFWLYTVSSTGAFALVWAGALHSILLFPNPWPPLARHRWIVPAFYVAPYLAFAAVTLAVPAPDALKWQQTMGQTTGYLESVYGLAALAAAFRSFRAAHDPISRAQVRWVATSFVFSFFCSFTLGMLPGIVLGRPLLSWSILALTGLTFPLAFAVAILRYRLFDIDLILNRTLVYGALTALIAGLYVVIVGAAGLAFQANNNLIVSLLATGLAAILFQPVRQRLQRAVNRLMYGERDDPYAVLARLGQRLETTFAAEDVLPAILETVAAALKLPYAAIRSQGALLASYGLLPAHTPPDSFALLYQGEMFGQLEVAPRAASEPFTPAEKRLLTDLARQVGVAVYNVRLHADLQKSREQLILAREEERRRLRRDLHDGLGPQLASQTLTLDAIEKLLDRDPATAKALLENLKSQSQDAIADIRRLIYDLRPPALDDLGLAAALQQEWERTHAGGASPDGVRIALAVPVPLPPLPAAVELAAFRIAQEAVNNVLKHAHAQTCTVRLEIQQNALLVEIQDDGRGLPEIVRSGVGFQSMRERANELGGRLEVGMTPGGGTRVTAWLPVQ